MRVGADRSAVLVWIEHVRALRRHTVTCSECHRMIVRARRDSALHNMAQHVAYDHAAEMHVERRLTTAEYHAKVQELRQIAKRASADA